MFTHLNQKQLILNELAIQVKKLFGIDITKQSIDKCFTDKSVEFLKSVLSKALELTIPKQDKIDFTKHDKVLIKDATSFQLPSNMADKYKGSGGSASSPIIKIQFEYDLKSGKITDLSLHAFVDQDDTNAKDTVGHINPNELVIRDLGYISTTVMKAIQKKRRIFSIGHKLPLIFIN